MAIDLPSNSRFRRTDVIRRDNNETFGLWKKPDFLTVDIPEQDIIKITVDTTNEGRPDLIANENYGDPQLSWVVIAFNRPLDPINWPPSGAVIQLPPVSLVLSGL